MLEVKERGSIITIIEPLFLLSPFLFLMIIGLLTLLKRNVYTGDGSEGVKLITVI